MVRRLCRSWIRESYVLAHSPPQPLQTSPPLSQDARTVIGTENFSGRHGPSPCWEFLFPSIHPSIQTIKISLSLNMRTVPGVAADRRCLGEILKGRSGEERSGPELTPRSGIDSPQLGSGFPFQLQTLHDSLHLEMAMRNLRHWVWWRSTDVELKFDSCL
jgi:hypothetical protein